MTTIPNTAEEVLAATEDLSKRKEWDELFIEGSVVEQIDADHQVLQFKFKVSSSLSARLAPGSLSSSSPSSSLSSLSLSLSLARFRSSLSRCRSKPGRDCSRSFALFACVAVL